MLLPPRDATRRAAARGASASAGDEAEALGDTDYDQRPKSPGEPAVRVALAPTAGMRRTGTVPTIAPGDAQQAGYTEDDMSRWFASIGFAFGLSLAALWPTTSSSPAPRGIAARGERNRKP